MLQSTLNELLKVIYEEILPNCNNDKCIVEKAEQMIETINKYKQTQFVIIEDDED